MNTSEKVIMLDAAKTVFFKAMLAGYANGSDSDMVVKVKTPDGYTTITFAYGDFVVVDRYCVTPYSDFSAGTTTISYNCNPIWIMFYTGYYPKKVIPFLKMTLADQYSKGIFFGGRGAHCGMNNENEHLFYWNICERNRFSYFLGREHIIDLRKPNVELGHHRYLGMSLL